MMTNLKHLTLSFLILLSLPSYAEVIEIYDIEKTELDGAFSLTNNKKGTEVVLDCTSFITNITVTRKEKSHFFHISNQECIDNLEYLNKLPNKRRCLNYNNSEYLINNCL